VWSIGRLLFVPILSNPASFGTNSGLFGTNFGTSFGTNFPVLFGQPSEHQETAAEMPIGRSNTGLAAASNDRGNEDLDFAAITARARSSSPKSQRRNRISPGRKTPAEGDCGQSLAACHARSRTLVRALGAGAFRDSISRTRR